MKVNTTRCYFNLSFLLLFLLFSSHSFVEGFNGEEEEKEIQRSNFPHEFLFGTGTSSYQIEGAYLEGGKSLSNWDVFTHIPGTIENGENGDISDDYYHRYLEDIEILHSLGVNAFRFSISWARVLPRGRLGEVNPSGIMFYNNVIDSLLLKGIEPFVTIHHYDLPEELEDRYGSWLSPLMQEDFVHFSETCFKYFGDRVKYWTTINEPNMFAIIAYMKGLYPPAHCSPPFGNCSVGNSNVEPLIAMHNMLLAHAKAAKLYREHFQPKQGGSIGIVVSAVMYEPLRGGEIDEEATKRALAFNLAWVLDPLVFGDYPPEMRHYLGSVLPRFSSEETKYIKGSIDFIGVNHYGTLYAKDCIDSSCSQGGDSAIEGYVYTTGDRDGVLIGEPTGLAKFFVVPRGMEEIIDYTKRRYDNMPMIVTENGYAPSLPEDEEVKVLLNDIKRIEFHMAYLSFLARAIRNGANVRGYFLWTLLDDFEWINGYGLRFGLYYVDRQTLSRIPKLSAMWYKNFLTKKSLSNGEATNASVFKNENIGVSQLMDEKAEI